MQLNLFGAFRSGTNYVRALLELNCRVEVVPGAGFKHAPVPARFEGPVLGVVKDPYSWLVSMWRYVNERGAKHTICGKTWKRFLREPLVVFHGDIPGFPRYRFASPIEYWNCMAYNLVCLDPGRTWIIRYEDLLEEPRTAIQTTAEAFGLESSADTFRKVEKRTRNVGARRQEKRVDSYVTSERFEPAYFLQHRYMDEFSRLQRRSVLRAIDPVVADAFMYPVAG